jgi:type IV secretion system protein TrbL
MSAAISPLRRAAAQASQSAKSSLISGVSSALESTGGSSTLGTVGGAAASANDPSFGSTTQARGAAQSPPDWAKRMQRSQRLSHGVQTTAHAVRSGEAHGGGTSISLSEGK